MLALPFAEATFDAATVGFGVRNVADLELALTRAAARAAPGRPARDPRDHAAARRAEAVLLALVRPRRAAARQGASRRLRVHVPAGVGEAVPAAEGLAALLRESGFGDVRFRCWRVDRRAPHRDGRVSALAQVHATPGLAGYMAEVEAGLARAVAAQPGLAQEVAGEALAAGGKRLRPLLCFLTAPGEPSVAAGVAVEMVHMATLVHDDLVDGARLRRGLPAAWSVYGADAAKAAGDYLYACAFAVLADDRRRARGRDARRRGALPGARRGDAEAADARPRHADRRVPRALRAQDRQADRGRVPARLRRRRPARRVRRSTSASRSRSPTTSSTARARRRRPGRSPAPICARGRRRCRSCSRRAQDDVVRARARRRPARRRARRGRRDRRDRALARGRARLRRPRARVPRRRTRTARSSRR